MPPVPSTWNSLVDMLIAGAKSLGLELSPSQIRGFESYYQDLVNWNRRANLTAVVDREGVQIVHFLDSLTVSLALPREVTAGGSLVDLGAGAGFPGLPLKLAYPRMSVALIEATGKKARFLEHVVASLGLKGATVHLGRAEVLGHYPALREAFDVAVARALGPMPVALELTLPFCRLGGWAIVQKKGDIRAELESSSRALSLLGGRMEEVRPVDIPGLQDRRVLVLVEKISPTPSRYPRRPGMPAKRPLRVR